MSNQLFCGCCGCPDPVTLTAAGFREINTETDLTPSTALVEGTIYVSKSSVCVPPDGKVSLGFTIDDGGVSRTVKLRLYTHVSLGSVMEMGEPVETLDAYNRVEVTGKTRQTDTTIPWVVSTMVRPDDEGSAITFSESFYPLSTNLPFDEIGLCIDKVFDGAEYAGSPEEQEGGEFMFARPADGDPPYIYKNPTLPADGLTHESDEETFEVTGDYTRVTSAGVVTALDTEDLEFIHEITSSCNVAAKVEESVDDRYADGTYIAFEMVSLGGATSVKVDAVTSGQTYIALEKECDTCEEPRGCTVIFGYEVPDGLADFTQAQFAQIFADVDEYDASEEINEYETGFLRYERNTRSAYTVTGVTGPVGYDFASETNDGPCQWQHNSDLVDYVVSWSYTYESETRYVWTEGGEEDIYFDSGTAAGSHTVRITTDIQFTADPHGDYETNFMSIGATKVKEGAADFTWTRDIKVGPGTVVSNHVVLYDCEYSEFNGHEL